MERPALTDVQYVATPICTGDVRFVVAHVWSPLVLIALHEPGTGVGVWRVIVSPSPFSP
jgi:hypothetical protein